MNTKFKNSKEIRKAFQDLLSFKSDEEEIKHQAQMVMFRFLSEIETLTEENNMTRKELAYEIGTSPSYLTQLYRGVKPLNMETIAKFQKVFNVTFEIKATMNIQADQPNEFFEHSNAFIEPKGEMTDGFWCFIHTHLDEKPTDISHQKVDSSFKETEKSAA